MDELFAGAPRDAWVGLPTGEVSDVLATARRFQALENWPD